MPFQQAARCSALARSVSKILISDTAEIASANPIALPTPPAPIRATAPRPEGDEVFHRPRESGGVGVVADQPVIANHDGIDRTDRRRARATFRRAVRSPLPCREM